MDNSIIEASYPVDFRKGDTETLATYLRNRQNTILIGMRRVGISSFLRFFIYQPQVQDRFIKDETRHLFVPVDLNNLVEREIFPFWILTLKRVVDVIEKSELSAEDKKYIETLFLDSIQSKDLFLLIENIRKAVLRIIEFGLYPTIFFIRFDRIKDAVTPEFFDNLQGLQDATNHKLSYIITSYRSLDKLSPGVFNRSSVSSFAKEHYIKPAKSKDIETVYELLVRSLKLEVREELKQEVLRIADGYNQYLQLSLIYLNEHNEQLKDAKELFSSLVKDERINLQSEELWESLDSKEQNILIRVSKGINLNDKEIKDGKYLFDTGIVEDSKISCLLFEYYIQQRESKSSFEGTIEFSKKEHKLFNFLKDNLDKVCEREQIIAAVWPEEDSLGVSDWAIDRLIARLRNKLKQQASSFEIVTIKTRGYKLINS